MGQLSQKILDAELDEAFIFHRDLTILVQVNSGADLLDPVPALVLNREGIKDLYTGETLTSHPFKSKTGEWFLWGFHRISDEYFLGVRENASRLARVDQLSVIFGFIGLAAIALTLVAGGILAGMLSRPVNRLVIFSRELGEGNFDTPIPDEMYGELGILRNAMDKMRTDLKKLTREKEEMMAQIAHELRNPLGGMELMTGLLRENLRKEKKNLSYVDKISSEIVKLKALVYEYLNYNRSIQVRPEWINIRLLVEEVKSLLQQPLQQKQLRLILSGEDIRTWFDPSHLRQILMNLISNGIDASPDRGKMVITVEQKDHILYLAISDQGPGIDEEDRSKIFQPFYSRKKNGVGLGLAICKKLCQANEAEIKFRNEDSGGCTFYITRPIPGET